MSAFHCYAVFLIIPLVDLKENIIIFYFTLYCKAAKTREKYCFAWFWQERYYSQTLHYALVKKCTLLVGGKCIKYFYFLSRMMTHLGTSFIIDNFTEKKLQTKLFLEYMQIHLYNNKKRHIQYTCLADRPTY